MPKNSVTIESRLKSACVTLFSKSDVDKKAMKTGSRLVHAIQSFQNVDVDVVDADIDVVVDVNFEVVFGTPDPHKGDEFEGCT